MRKLIAGFSLLLLVGLAGAELQEVQYSIDTDESMSEINTSVYMSCDSTCTGLKWSIPDNSEVIFVRNSRGEMDYEEAENTVNIPGSRANGRENETIKIGTRIDEEADEVYEGLYQRTISIPSFQGVETTGFVYNEDLISGRIGFGFDYSFTGGEMRFKGQGPTNVRVKFGEGQKSNYFEFFGSKPEGTDSAYEVPIGVLGFQQRFERFPVAVMTDADYDRLVNEWSSGEYVGGGIKIREPESIETSFNPVLAHEVVHGLNDRRLNWDQTSSSYFDEGVSKYVESLMRKKMYNEGETDRKAAELFGEEKEYRIRRDGQRYIYTVPPKPSKDGKEILWNYYQEERDFMRNWSAFSSSDPDTRSFGYAYSELIIANYIARDGGSIRELYNDLEVDRRIVTTEQKWNLLSNYLDMTPCKFDDRQRFENCLEEINSYDFPVYSAQPSQDRSTEIRIVRLEVPNRTEPSNKLPSLETGNLSSTGNQVEGFLSGFISYLGSLIQDLAASF